MVRRPSRAIGSITSLMSLSWAELENLSMDPSNERKHVGIVLGIDFHVAYHAKLAFWSMTWRAHVR